MRRLRRRACSDGDVRVLPAGLRRVLGVPEREMRGLRDLLHLSAGLRRVHAEVCLEVVGCALQCIDRGDAARLQRDVRRQLRLAGVLRRAVLRRSGAHVRPHVLPACNGDFDCIQKQCGVELAACARRDLLISPGAGAGVPPRRPRPPSASRVVEQLLGRQLAGRPPVLVLEQAERGVRGRIRAESRPIRFRFGTIRLNIVRRKNPIRSLWSMSLSHAQRVMR